MNSGSSWPRYSQPKGGQPPIIRGIVDDILWIVRTKAPWRNLPEHYGAWQTVASRFYRYS